MKHSTIVRYKELTERIYHQIGHIKLKELRADHLNDLYTLLGQDGQSKRGGKLSATTILKYHRLISTVLEQAVKGDGTHEVENACSPASHYRRTARGSAVTEMGQGGL